MDTKVTDQSVAVIVTSETDVGTRQRNVLKELFSAQTDGYISHIDGIIKRCDRGGYYRVVYDPDTHCHSSDDVVKAKSKIVISQEDVKEPTIDDFPMLETIHVVFNDHVKCESIEKIAKYIEKKYSCSCIAYPTKKLDVYKF